MGIQLIHMVICLGQAVNIIHPFHPMAIKMNKACIIVGHRLVHSTCTIHNNIHGIMTQMHLTCTVVIIWVVAVAKVVNQHQWFHQIDHLNDICLVVVVVWDNNSHHQHRNKLFNHRRAGLVDLPVVVQVVVVHSKHQH